MGYEPRVPSAPIACSSPCHVVCTGRRRTRTWSCLEGSAALLPLLACTWPEPSSKLFGEVSGLAKVTDPRVLRLVFHQGYKATTLPPGYSSMLSPKHREKNKTKRNETQHHCAIGCDPVSCKSSGEGKSYLKNSKARCGFALRYLSPSRTALQCAVLEAAAGSWLWELIAVSLLQLGSSREALTPGMWMHAHRAAPHSRLGLHVRLGGAGLPWPLLCPFPQDDVRLGTDLVKLVSGVACCLLPSASGPRSLACIKLHKSQGCCQFPLVRKGQMEARVTTFMFLSGSGCTLHSGREACAVPRWALASDVPVWAARALGLVL